MGRVRLLTIGFICSLGLGATTTARCETSEVVSTIAVTTLELPPYYPKFYVSDGRLVEPLYDEAGRTHWRFSAGQTCELRLKEDRYQEVAVKVPTNDLSTEEASVQVAVQRRPKEVVTLTKGVILTHQKDPEQETKGMTSFSIGGDDNLGSMSCYGTALSAAQALQAFKGILKIQSPTPERSPAREVPNFVPPSRDGSRR